MSALKTPQESRNRRNWILRCVLCGAGLALTVAVFWWAQPNGAPPRGAGRLEKEKIVEGAGESLGV
jgi:ferric-dicitrate binding protein FerR (iron transport regulator)